MIQQILALTWKDLKVFARDQSAMMLIFLQPFLFIVVMSYATAGMYRTGDRSLTLLAVNEDRGPVGTQMVQQLAQMNGFTVETSWDGAPLRRGGAESLVSSGKRGMAVVIPTDFSSQLAQVGAQAKLTLITDPATPSQVVGPVLGTLQGLVSQSALAASMPQTVNAEFGERATVERVAPPGMHVTQFPDVFQQNVPGYTIYGLFWIVSLLAGSVLVEKREGTFRRLLAAPMSRTALLAGKLLPYYLINLLQVIIMLGASRLLFGLNLGSSPAGLIAVSLAVSAAATGMGVLVAALAHTEAQVGGLTTTVLLVMSALGGSFIPRLSMPAWLQTVGLITPHAWALDAYQDLLVRGYGFMEVLPKVGILAAFALVFFAVGVWRFRFE